MLLAKKGLCLYIVIVYIESMAGSFYADSVKTFLPLCDVYFVLCIVDISIVLTHKYSSSTYYARLGNKSQGYSIPANQSEPVPNHVVNGLFGNNRRAQCLSINIFFSSYQHRYIDIYHLLSIAVTTTNHQQNG